jgi:hypothetical protein
LTHILSIAALAIVFEPLLPLYLKIAPLAIIDALGGIGIPKTFVPEVAAVEAVCHPVAVGEMSMALFKTHTVC